MPGWILTLDGCPYRFGTPGVATPSPTSSDADWDTSPTLLAGYLEDPAGWTERVSPTTGELEVGPQTFRVHDHPAPSGPAAGYPVVTWLDAWDEDDVTQTFLTASATSGATTLTVASTTGFPSSGNLWLEGEAVAYSGVTATTFTGCSRGCYNSRALAHTVAGNFAPVVYAQPTWLLRRRALLWHVAGDGAATLAWVGYADRPRLAADLARWELACANFWGVERQISLGISDAVVGLRGFDLRRIWCEYHEANRQVVGSRGAQYATTTDAIRETFAGAVREAADVMAFGTTGTGGLLAVHPTRDIRPVVRATVNGADVRVTSATADLYTVVVTVNGEAYEGAARAMLASAATLAQVDVSPAPPVLVVLRHAVVTDVPIASTAGLPRSSGSPTWPAAVVTTSAPYTTRADLTLTAELDDDQLLEVRAVTGYSDSARTVTGLVWRGFVRESARAYAPPVSEIVVDRNAPLRLGLRVDSDHFLHAIRYGLLTGSAPLDVGLHPDNYDWTALAATTSARGSGLTAVTWRLWGQTNLWDLIKDSCALHGIGVGIRAGRVAFFALRLPTESETPVATFAATDYVDGERATYGTGADTLVNHVDLQAPAYRAVVRSGASVGRFGAAPKRSIDATGLLAVSRDGVAPGELRDLVVQSVFGLWGLRVRRVSFAVSLEHAWDVWCGDFVRYTHPHLPDGAGNRGASGRLGQVVERELVLTPGRGFLRLTVLDYGRRAVGYSPCVRAADVTGAVLTAALDYVYASGTTTTTDYAGSDLDDYEGVANDGGVGWFVAGDKVTLVERDNTSPATPEELTVLSVDTAARTITFTSSPAAGWDTIITGGGIVDLRYSRADISGLQAAQQAFAWVGTETDGTVDGEFPAKRWAP